MIAITSDNVSASLLANRYLLLDLVGQGGMGKVFRAADRLNGQTIALKRVYSSGWKTRMTSTRPADGLEVALAHEFRTLASLRHPNIISVLDYGFDHMRQPFFTMDLLENAVTIVEAGYQKPLVTQVDLLIQLLRALDYLHRRQVIHCDLKPSNVLVVNGQVKVLDFGLAAHSGNNDDPTGSVLYMAPETLSNGTVDITSDLYTVGVIAYEMISGSLPFMDGDLETLIEAIHNTPPDLQHMGVFAPILSTLLSKDPHDRYRNARLVMAELGKLLPESPPMETSAVRESLLQAAQFVGRDVELDKLQQVMKDAITGSGSAWLIGGESGVGKSRLLDELQIRALIDGMLVVRGQSISEGGSPYQMWRGILRWLGLLTDLSDYEASTFKVLVPEIELLLNRPVANLAETDVQLLQNRLIVAVNQVLQRQPHPIAILLEDIHWAEDESLALLARLSASISQRPILILATYRDDERPDLPTLLDKTQVLSLKRLNEEGISEFAAGVLGLSKLGSTLPKLLYRETEGNLFFLIEVMRALTEEAGQIDAIRTMDIPEHIVTGGIQRFVQRRLHRVVPEYQPLLKLAAVIGRQFDLKVLAHLQPAANLQAWLDHCTNVAVLELREDTWGFSHDKLRNGLLLELPSAERRELHHQVALTLEALYADLPEYAAGLAYQWGEAGETIKQVHYLIKAGEVARRTGANTTAAEMLDKAARLATAGQLSVAERVSMERLRGDTYLALGKLGESVIHVKEALNLLGHQPPNNKRLLAATMKELLVQIVHRLGSNPRPVNKERADELIQIAEVYQHLTLYYYFMGDTLPSLHANLSTLNYAEAANKVSPELATAYGSIAVAAGVIMLHKAAAFYFNKAEAVAQAVDIPRVWIGLIQRRTVYHLGRAEWMVVERGLANGKVMVNSLRDERTRRELMSTEIFQLNFQGKLEQSAALASELRRSAELDQDMQNMLYSASFGGAALLRLGRYNEAIEMLSEFKDLDSTVVPSSERGRILNLWGILSLCYFYQGRYEEAREAVKVVVNALTINTSPDSGFPFVFGYTACLETCLKLREYTVRVKDEALYSMTNVILKAFHSYAKRFEVGRPGYYRLRGLAYWLDGKQNAARKSWADSLEWSHRLSIPLEEALVLGEIGRHSSDEAVRTTTLSQAFSIFDRLGISAYREQYLASPTTAPLQQADSARPGIRIYSGFTLKFYDLVVLGLSNTFVWQVPTRMMLDFYNEHVSDNHLDVGVGTGYFLDKCRFPSDQPRITLMDLNPTSLKVTASRLQRFKPTTVVANVLEPIQTSGKYYSIGLSYLLHCLPGSMHDKAAVFQNLKPLLSPGGVLFGVTLLGQGVQRNLLARMMMRLYNRTGTFSNTSDSLEELEHILKDNFNSYSIRVVGCAAFFTTQA